MAAGSIDENIKQCILTHSALNPTLASAMQSDDVQEITAFIQNTVERQSINLAFLLLSTKDKEDFLFSNSIPPLLNQNGLLNDINQETKEEWLVTAIKAKNISLVLFLLINDAKPKNWDRTVSILNLAIQLKNMDIARILFQHLSPEHQKSFLLSNSTFPLLNQNGLLKNIEQNKKNEWLLIAISLIPAKYNH